MVVLFPSLYEGIYCLYSKNAKDDENTWHSLTCQPVKSDI